MKASGTNPKTQRTSQAETSRSHLESSLCEAFDTL